MYLSMNQQTGKALPDTYHIRQSVRNILITPQGSRIARREYGSMLFAGKPMDIPGSLASPLPVAI